MLSFVLFVEIPCAKVRRPWSEAEKTAVQRRLGKFVAERKVPKKEHCMKCLEVEKDLANRSWKDVKNCVQHDCYSELKICL